MAWSAVYNVADGYGGSADAALGGELLLYDPRMPAVRMLPLDLRCPDPDGAAARISIAMNADAVREAVG